MSELNDTIHRLLDSQIEGDGFYITPIPGLALMRSALTQTPHHMNYRPKLCLVTQGAKEVMIADQTIRYGAGQALVVTVEVPVLSHVVDASREAPFTGVTLELDPDIVLDVLTRLDPKRHPQGGAGFGLMVNPLDDEISASVLRLLRLVDQPQAIDILYPAIMREIAYWLLTGPAGRNVARMVLPEGQPLRIAGAIAHLRQNFDAPVNVVELARSAGMSPSSFHQHFKTLTSMSPLQYQKHLRLLEARRLMMTEGEKAGVAAMSVGYESVSQFSREYARMFGSPPRRETQRAKADPARMGEGVADLAL
jgi:AraC-like DNA-binding protein